MVKGPKVINWYLLFLIQIIFKISKQKYKESSLKASIFRPFFKKISNKILEIMYKMIKIFTLNIAKN